MADAGFFRGTSAEQDNRFLDKQKKLLKSMRFDDVLNKKVDMDKVNLDVIKPWITKKLIEILGVEDDVVMQYVLNMLESEKSPDPRFMQINITGFLQSKNAREFMKELWSLLLSAQENIGGIPSTFLEKKKEEIKQRKLEQERIQANLQKYQGDQQQTEPDSTATDENVGNENGSAAATGDITEEIRKAKEVAQALAGKDNSPKHGYKKSKRNTDNSDSDDSDDGGAARKKKEATKNTEENAERAEFSSAVKVKKEREVEERSPSKLLQPKWRSRLLSSAARPVDRDKPGWDKEHMQNVALTKTPERASSGSRKGSGRAGSANMPSTGGSRNNSAESESGRVDSGGSRRSANRSAGRTKLITSDNDDSFSFGGAKEVDATYADPLGEAPARPKTAGRQRPQQAEDEFGDEEIGDDLLPE